MMRPLRADVLLVENLRALLDSRRIDHKTLAMWCGHKPPWVSKILSGERGVRVHELGKIADFFALTVADLFQYGVAASTERRRVERRRPTERRSRDRRAPRGDIHPDVLARFPAKTPDGADDHNGRGRYHAS